MRFRTSLFVAFSPVAMMACSHVSRVESTHTIEPGDSESGDGEVKSAKDSKNDSAPAGAAAAEGAWQEARVAQKQNLGGFVGSMITWQDEENKPRGCLLVDNDALDPASFYGGYVRQCTYLAGTSEVTAAPRAAASDQPGWGYTVHHVENGGDADTMSSRRAPGAFRTVFAGRHHVMHEYTWTTLRSQGNGTWQPPVDRAVRTTIRYVFSTGSSEPVWAHTVDTSQLGANQLVADDRSPYGELNYDGVEGSPSGLGWGDKYKFRTKSSPVTFDSTWDYTTQNQIPHTLMWTDAPTNLEMGVVQTESHVTKDSGYGWFYSNWGHTSENRMTNDGTSWKQNMPLDWNWTYQLNQYSLSWDRNSKRLAWGLNFGGVGKTSYSHYGDAATGSGYPYRSSSARFVLGAKGSTDRAIDHVSAALGVTLTASVGAVAKSGPFGIGGAASKTQSYGDSGYDPVYGVFTVAADNQKVQLALKTGEAELVNPVFRITNYSGELPAVVSLDDQTLRADVDYFASTVTFDGSKELWLTLKKRIRQMASIRVN